MSPIEITFGASGLGERSRAEGYYNPAVCSTIAPIGLTEANNITKDQQPHNVVAGGKVTPAKW